MPILYQEIDPVERRFAWWPVRVGGKLRWLSYVNRQRSWWYARGVNFNTYDYS